MCRQVGAQNAGKSSLINAMRRAVGYGKPKNELTTAALPGTTLGECGDVLCPVIYTYSVPPS